MPQRTIRARLRGIEVWLIHDSWHAGPLLLARSRTARLSGIHAVPADWGLLMRTRSVHGFGMRRHLTIAGIDQDGRVAAVRRLQPRRIVVMPRVTWIAELPMGSLPPALGWRLELVRAGGAGASS